jgi:hypothetical protein
MNTNDNVISQLKKAEILMGEVFDLLNYAYSNTELTVLSAESSIVHSIVHSHAESYRYIGILLKRLDSEGYHE